MKEDIEYTLISAIAKQKRLDPSSIHSDSSLEELGITSLDAITIVYEVEEAFDVEVPNEELEKLTTVSEIVAGIRKLIAEKG